MTIATPSRLLFVLLLSGCAHEDVDGGWHPLPPPPQPPPQIGISVAPTAVTVVRGQSSSAVVSVTRVSYFTFNVDLSAEGLPATVTAAFSPTAVPEGTPSSLLTVSAGPGTALGQHTVILRASGFQVPSRTASLVVTVTP